MKKVSTPWRARPAQPAHNQFRHKATRSSSASKASLRMFRPSFCCAPTDWCVTRLMRPAQVERFDPESRGRRTVHQRLLQRHGAAMGPRQTGDGGTGAMFQQQYRFHVLLEPRRKIPLTAGWLSAERLIRPSSAWNTISRRKRSANPTHGSAWTGSWAIRTA